MSERIDFEQLEAARETAGIDKADLFDFYNDNWDRLVDVARGVTLNEDERKTLRKVRGYFAEVSSAAWNDEAVTILDRLIGGDK